MKQREPGSPHEALEDLMAEIPGGVAAAAAELDRHPGTLYKALDPDSREQFSFRWVAQLTRRFRLYAAASFLARQAGGKFLPLPPENGGEIPTLTAEIAEDIGRVVRAALEATSEASPGGREINRREARDLLRKLLDADRHIATMIGRVQLLANPQEET